MDPSLVEQLAGDLLLVLGAGLISGLLCRRLGVSMLVGYLVAGALIGHGALGWISESNYPLKVLAEAGVLLLLFSIGIELSLESLRHTFRWLIVGGATQMLLVAVPVALVLRLLVGMAWPGAALLAAAVAFSSTVLVFKALTEWGQATAPHGRRAIGILLFQDIALVPLILLIPMLAEDAEAPTLRSFVVLALKSTLLVAVVVVFRAAVRRWIVPWLQRLRSVELVVLFTLTVLGAFGLVAHTYGLPAMLGALAAGAAVGGNRLTKQIDALILPYRETFAAVFFVSLGTLMQFDVFASGTQTAIALALLAAVLVLKTAAALVALRLTGLPWRGALGMGVGLAQMGEFSFVLLAIGLDRNLIPSEQSHLLIPVALGTLIVTPQLLKTGLRLAKQSLEEQLEEGETAADEIRHAVVIGAGPIGRQVASQLETSGVDVCLIDFSPVNLHAYALQGFRTVAGDACDPQVLRRAEIEQCGLAVVTVPRDTIAETIALSIRRRSRACKIVVRCRYRANVSRVKKAGADRVISEEVEASDAIARLLQEMTTRSR